jgi:hypothetical protein
MVDEFLKQLFITKTYTKETIILYTLAGILAGLTRLTIRNDNKVKFKSWWNDGTLLGALIISIAGALLFDNNFLWSFLGGYFIVYILEYIQNALTPKKKDK